MTAGGVAPFNHDPGPYRKNIDRRPVSADLIRESVEVGYGAPTSCAAKNASRGSSPETHHLRGLTFADHLE
jgi:hypothetical protein